MLAPAHAQLEWPVLALTHAQLEWHMLALTHAQLEWHVLALTHAQLEWHVLALTHAQLEWPVLALAVSVSRPTSALTAINHLITINGNFFDAYRTYTEFGCVRKSAHKSWTFRM